jgi:hypothetical protein
MGVTGAARAASLSGKQTLKESAFENKGDEAAYSHTIILL